MWFLVIILTWLSGVLASLGFLKGLATTEDGEDKKINYSEGMFWFLCLSWYAFGKSVGMVFKEIATELKQKNNQI